MNYNDASFSVGVHFGNGHRRPHVCRRYVHGPYYHRGYYGRGGYYKKVCVPPVYHVYYDECGCLYKKRVRHGYYKRVWIPGPRRRVVHHRKIVRHHHYD